MSGRHTGTRGKAQKVLSRRIVPLGPGASREVLTLDCGHDVTRAPRPNRSHWVYCPTCLDAVTP